MGDELRYGSGHYGSLMQGDDFEERALERQHLLANATHRSLSESNLTDYLRGSINAEANVETIEEQQRKVCLLSSSAFHRLLICLLYSYSPDSSLLSSSIFHFHVFPFRFLLLLSHSPSSLSLSPRMRMHFLIMRQRVCQ
jgi:hypothetical protein